MLSSEPLVSPLAYPSEETRSVREGDQCLRMKSPVIIDSRRTLRFPPDAESLESRLIHQPKQAPLMGKESDWLLLDSQCYSVNEQCLRVVDYLSFEGHIEGRVVTKVI